MKLYLRRGKVQLIQAFRNNLQFGQIYTLREFIKPNQIVQLRLRELFLCSVTQRATMSVAFSVLSCFPQ